MYTTYNKLKTDANVFPFVRREGENVEAENYFCWDDGNGLAFDDNNLAGW